METDDREIGVQSDKWQDGITPWAAHQQTAATERTDVHKSPPTAPITEHAHVTEGLQSSSGEGEGGTLSCVRAHDDGLKGKMTSNSNQLSGLICYFIKRESIRQGANTVRTLLHKSSH